MTRVTNPQPSADLPAALVTGASRGIGRAIARELASLDYGVAVNYAHNAAAAEGVVAEIRDAGGRAFAVRGDVGRDPDRRGLVDTVLEQFGRLDVLVNNAGITSPGRNDLLEATEESWDRVFDTNLKGPYFLTQLAARAMIEQIESGRIAGGKVINISSISAYAVSTDRGDYCLSKSAMGMMTSLWAARLADQKIGVYEICPGVIDSDMTAPVRAKYDRLIEEGLSPIRRWGQAQDIARAVAAIVGDYFPFSTGERFNVDGGFHIRRL